LVLQFGLSPSYVLNEIQQYEIKSLMDFGYYKHKEQWEQTRLISYLIAQTNSKKKLKLQDIIKFQWETDNESTKITNEEINDLSKQAQEIEAMFAENKEDNTTNTNGK
jgi:hypothetical protein